MAREVAQKVGRGGGLLSLLLWLFVLIAVVPLFPPRPLSVVLLRLFFQLIPVLLLLLLIVIIVIITVVVVILRREEGEGEGRGGVFV